jgi:tRNA (mo5U34)-methyltransferase
MNDNSHPERSLFEAFYQSLTHSGLEKYRDELKLAIDAEFSTTRHRELGDWLDALSDLPELSVDTFDCKGSVSLESDQTISAGAHRQLHSALSRLIPWRKGPFQFFDIHVNTEWRSDWKWERVVPHLHSLENRKVLDVGCGSGYHCWRSYGEGASWVLGIDPSPRFVVQFQMLKRYVPNAAVHVIPLKLEDLPGRLNYFDTTFSMGVLYHRTSPIDHLKELRDTLRSGGELVLETLVIEGEENQILMPNDRYAQMRNVWFIPSVPELIKWVEKCGFKHARCVDLNRTDLNEQRTTEWMPSHSLKEFLKPDDPSLTVEGYPAPLRAVIVAERK